MGVVCGVGGDGGSNGGAEGDGCVIEEGDGDSRGEGDMCDGSGKGEEVREFGKGGVRECDREASDVEGEELGQGMSRP